MLLTNISRTEGNQNSYAGKNKNATAKIRDVCAICVFLKLLLLVVVIDHPMDPELIGKHPKECAPKRLVERHRYFSAG